MEATVYDELAAMQLRRQIKFFPQLLSLAGKNRLRARMITVETIGEREQTREIAGGWPAAAVLLSGIRGALGILNEIFDQNGLFAMRLIGRNYRLEVKADRRIIITLKFGQTAECLTRDHQRAPLLIWVMQSW